MSRSPAGPTDEAPIGQRLQWIRGQLDEACQRVGRDPGEVVLLPVSKTRPASDLVASMAAGYRTFGENQAAELAQKAELLSADGARFEMIGHLQTNKAREIARWATRFHALDSLKLASTLDRRLQSLGRDLDVLIQVNSSGEESKFGLPPEAVADFARSLAPFHALRPTGLMTIAAHTDDPQRIADCFATTAGLAARLREDAVGDSAWAELSMGMSADFASAIAHGATIVRIGRAVFGARHPTKSQPA